MVSRCRCRRSEDPRIRICADYVEFRNVNGDRLLRDVFLKDSGTASGKKVMFREL